MPELEDGFKRITFSGSSDDLIHISGFGKEFEEFCIVRDIHIATFEIRHNWMKMTIDVIYRGTWGFAITGDDGSGDILPDWKISRQFGSKWCAHTEVVEIDVPIGAMIERIF